MKKIIVISDVKNSLNNRCLNSKEYVTIAVLTSIQFKITEQVKYNIFNRIVDMLDEELRDKQ